MFAAHLFLYLSFSHLEHIDWFSFFYTLSSIEIFFSILLCLRSLESWAKCRNHYGYTNECIALGDSEATKDKLQKKQTIERFALTLTAYTHKNRSDSRFRQLLLNRLSVILHYDWALNRIRNETDGKKDDLRNNSNGEKWKQFDFKIQYIWHRAHRFTTNSLSRKLNTRMRQ